MSGFFVDLIFICLFFEFYISNIFYFDHYFNFFKLFGCFLVKII